tara:strand:- start:4485 stop:4688 length:204 start_codon:yes stop_codon:yes gene_type:complete
MSDAARIYIELGEAGAEQYAHLIREENYLLDKLQHQGDVNAFQLEKLNRIQEEIYQLKQDAGIVSSR